MKGAAPFDGVDLVLVTHDHPDRFDARLAVRCLEDLPGPLLVDPADAVAEMCKMAADWFPLEPNCARFLQEVFRPDHIALTHLPVRLEGDAPGKIHQVRVYYSSGHDSDGRRAAIAPSEGPFNVQTLGDMSRRPTGVFLRIGSKEETKRGSLQKD